MQQYEKVAFIVKNKGVKCEIVKDNLSIESEILSLELTE